MMIVSMRVESALATGPLASVMAHPSNGSVKMWEVHIEMSTKRNGNVHRDILRGNGLRQSATKICQHS
jgi:hypothetical protein